ncbi:phosphotransferase enzyme family protein [Akanthomyces lecanii RCEF 1005]|uniref:Phosphotransferase enzyme family protein n=1 Tax=Akanthomyces lecanii RCEF 1005 TaxID=1081108 RepID=A0A168IGQ1_CORDF|nr:phosphotransferase enzyme family protein [Akanthomyces lecanii RCEF 1005]
MRRHFSEFLAIVKSREDEMYGNSILHDEWAGQTEDAKPLIANALENWTEVDWFIHQSVYNKDPSAAEAALSAFADEDPLRSLLAEVKEQDYRKYQKEVDLLQHETDGERELADAKLPWTLDWTAGTQKLQDYARVIAPILEKLDLLLDLGLGRP